jgi:hypothetical protein
VLALVQASGLVDAHPRTQSGFLRQSLQFGVQVALAIPGAGRPRRPFRAGIMTDEDVVLKCGQAAFLLDFG